MKKDTVVDLKKPEVVAEDPLMEILRNGAKRLLTWALEAEVDDFLKRHENVRDLSGNRMITRNGHLPPRTIQTGIGDIEVKVPRAADRRKDGPKIRFTSSILPLPQANQEYRRTAAMALSERNIYRRFW